MTKRTVEEIRKEIKETHKEALYCYRISRGVFYAIKDREAAREGGRLFRRVRNLKLELNRAKIRDWGLRAKRTEEGGRIMVKIGFQWYVRCSYEDDVLQEYTFDSLEEVPEAIAKYFEGRTIPWSACGIDKVENDEGYIRILEQIVVPTATYWGEYEENE